MMKLGNVFLFGPPPSLEDIDQAAQAALRAMPAELSAYCTGIVIRVEEFAADDILDEMGLESAFDLLGLYQGVAIGLKEQVAAPSNVDMIFLYRRPILDYWCETGEDLASVVRHVLIHEIGHHVGFSDDDMDAIEREA